MVIVASWIPEPLDLESGTIAAIFEVSSQSLDLPRFRPNKLCLSASGIYIRGINVLETYSTPFQLCLFPTGSHGGTGTGRSSLLQAIESSLAKQRRSVCPLK
jgi:hypothetical protein